MPTLYSVLETLKPILKSIDIRTIAVARPNEDSWENMVTSIFVSGKSLDEEKSKQGKLPSIKNNNLVIFYNVLPFDYTIFSKISNGEIMFPTIYGRQRTLFRQFDPLTLPVNSIPIYLDENKEWLLRSESSGIAEERSKFLSIIDQEAMAKRGGTTQSFKDLINTVLGITNYDVHHAKDLIITITDLPYIENPSFNNSLLKIKINTFGLRNLQINSSIIKVSSGNRIPTWISPISLEGKQEELVTIELPGLKPLDVVEVELIHKILALTMHKIEVKAPLRNVVEPSQKH